MCGILCCLSPTEQNIPGFSDRLSSIKHRGPDDTNIKIVKVQIQQHLLAASLEMQYRTF